jgi:hypothetical protein
VKLLGIIDSIDFSDVERERIGQTLGRADSPQRSILSSNALLIRDNDFWRKAQKNFHITGFRDGSQHGKQKVLSKALESANSEPGRAAWLAVGPIYVKAVQIYLERQVPNLHQLLRSEDFVAGPGTQTEQIFRCICRALPMHDATIDEAKELYELWGFERTPQIEEILSSVSIRADDVRRMVAESLSTTRREIAAAVTTTRSDLMRHLESQSGELSAIAANLDALREHQSNITSQLSELKSKEEQRPIAPTTPPPEKASRRSRLQAINDELEKWPDQEQSALWWNVRKACTYIRAHTRFLVNYGARHRKGLPISSSIAESAVNVDVSRSCPLGSQ